MRRPLVWAGLVAAAALPVPVALAHSIQPANLPDGRLQIKGSGYVNVQYNKTTKKVNDVQVYYPCRAAGAAKSKYPEYLSLETNPRVPIHGGRASSTYTTKITDSLATRAMGDVATVTWSVRGVRFSKPGLSGTVSVTVSGPAAVCPFSLQGKHLVPLEDTP